jgi:nitrogen fixation protein NifU and related proteins
VSELRDLYQELVLDHGQRPRNFRRPPQWTRHAEGFNPLCGDRITVFVGFEAERIVDLGFEGAGCAICKASASLMTVALKGKSRAEADRQFARFHEMVTGDPSFDEARAGLGKLAVFAGVREFPARVKCATLAWHTLEAALGGQREVVSTE